MMAMDFPADAWYLSFTAKEAGSTIAVKATTGAPSLTLYYSTDLQEWDRLRVGVNTITLGEIGDTVWIKAGSSGNNALAYTDSAYNYFEMTGCIEAAGNIMSLLNGGRATTTITATRCFEKLFYGCTSMTKPPELPATTLTEYCYASMFEGCTSLTRGPELVATTVPSNAYDRIFYGCSALAEICVRCNEWTDSFTDWMNGVASSGNFRCSVHLGMNPYIDRGASKCPTDWTVLNFKEDWVLCFTAEEANSTVKLNYNKYQTTNETVDSGSIFTKPDPQIKMAYSLDGVLWQNLATGSSIELENEGDKIFVLSGLEEQTLAGHYFGYTDKLFTNTPYTPEPDTPIPSVPNTTNANYYSFAMTGKIAASGDVSSVTGKTKGNMPDGAVETYLTYRSLGGTNRIYYKYGRYFIGHFALFQGCTALTKAPEFSATTLTPFCYASMFEGCTGLKEMPKLPAIEWAKGSTWGSLGSNSGCYNRMFAGCAGLEKASDLPANASDGFGYDSMFEGCYSLKESPAIPSTAKYVTGMFKNCIALEKIKVAFTAWPESTTGWVGGVADGGVFECPAALGTNATITRGVDACPEEWTVVNAA